MHAPPIRTLARKAGFSLLTMAPFAASAASDTVETLASMVGVLISVVMPIVVVALIIWVIVRQRLKLRALRRQDYAWYTRTWPQCLTRNGISCHNCGGRRIHTQRLMQRSFLRAHFCAQCGDTLYYSPEVEA